ncbi:MAG: single-stranded-DNA-specific exonuclease RecJ [Chloroflexi bacterium RBG_19FT_COMBO_48_23]|nr:MAG: single-stranded-DNA-specific exonuclease RecJ [Chloroflexi bacterium RBG_19FT_COMBO_48_23]
MSRTHWRLITPVTPPTDIPGVHPLLAQLLYNRGISEISQIELFLNADSRLEADPFLLPDMHQAVSRTYQALLTGEEIAIYGDFDADGITATALLVQGLSALGGKVIPYIPHRYREGYGLQVAALEKLRKRGISLIITVDTGITAITEIQKAQKMGMDIIVTDHHLPLASLPPALAVVDPKRSDSVCQSMEFAGVGVAFKFLQALLKGSGREELLNGLLDLVALGTVTDMVPLIGDNRYWVKRGLELLNNTERIGLQEMMRGTSLKPGNLDTESISWVLGPRLNAAGRLDDAATSYQLLLTQDPQEAALLASDLEEKNAKRQRLTRELLERARERIIATGIDLPLLMTGEEDYSTGVMGLVAGRLTEEFYRPVIIFKFGTDTCRGSGRSIPEFDLMAALKDCRDLLSNFGGHTKAAGFTVPTTNLPQLQKRLLNLAQTQLAGLDLRPHIDIDAEVPLAAFAGETFKEIQRLAPFGSGNPLPAFVSRHVEIINQRPIGSQGEHLGLKLKQEGIAWDAIGFRFGNRAQEITTYLDIAYNLDIDRWNGEQRLRLKLLDFDPVH